MQFAANTIMPAAQSVADFVNRNNLNPFDERDARVSPATRGCSQTSKTDKTAGLSQAERQRKATNARVPVPTAHPTHFKVKSETGMSGIATAIANRSVSVASSRDPQPGNAFDDTDLDDTVGSGLSTIGGEEHYMNFTTDYNHPRGRHPKTDDAQYYTQPHGDYKLNNSRFPLGKVIPDNWQEVVKIEKGLQAGVPCPSSVAGDFDDGRQICQEDDQEYGDQKDIESQTEGGENDMEGLQRNIDDEQSHHEGQVPDPTPSRIRSNHMPPPQLKVTSKFATTSIPTSKTSSYVEASEDEAPPIQPLAKKVRIELDYDPQVLKTMSYADLDKQPFDRDPRAPDTATPVDEHGVPLTLHRKLSNLSRMKEEDVRAMFLSQKDQEWEDTGAWFMGRFEAQMRRLMEIRQERRMIALKFEMEAKRRQAAVAAKTSDVEQELRYLKMGGKDLMEKRVSPMK